MKSLKTLGVRKDYFLLSVAPRENLDNLGDVFRSTDKQVSFAVNLSSESSFRYNNNLMVKNIYRDYTGKEIELPEERWNHITKEHPEIKSLKPKSGMSSLSRIM